MDTLRDKVLFGFGLTLIVLRTCAEGQDIGPRMDEICEGDTFRAQCGNNEVIIMQTALYGRNAAGRCVHDVDPNCETNVLLLFDAKCSGRNKCEFRVSAIIDELDPADRRCTARIRGSLQAAYKCVPVLSSTPGECNKRTQPPIVTQTEGFISSHYANLTGCGNYETPWRLTLPKGYHIKFDLLDFGNQHRNPSRYRDGIDRTGVCQVYVVIKEIGLENPLSTSTICASDRRFTERVYESTSNQVEVRVATGKSMKQREFLLRYTAMGCPEPMIPQNGWVIHVSGSARVTYGCNFTRDTWEVMCENGQWPVSHVQCPALDAAVRTGSSSSKTTGNLAISGTKGYVFILALTTAVTLALVVFLVGVFFIRRKRHVTLAYAGRDHVYHRPSLADYYTHAVPPAPLEVLIEEPHDTIQNKPLPPRPNTGPAPLPSHSSLPNHGPNPSSSSSLYNDYKRTWQLQRGGAPGGRCTDGGPRRPNSQSSGSTLAAVNDSSPQDERGRPMSEHIYESPVFGRKMMFSPIEDSEVRRPMFELASENGTTSSAFTD